jgi:hypothetical protein
MWLEVFVSFIGVLFGAFFGVYLEQKCQSRSTLHWLIGFYQHRERHKKENIAKLLEARKSIHQVHAKITQVIESGQISLQDWVLLTDLLLIFESPRDLEVLLKGVGVLPSNVLFASSQVREEGYRLDFLSKSCHHYREAVLLPQALQAPIKPIPTNNLVESSISRYGVMLTGLDQAVDAYIKAENHLTDVLHKWRPRDFPRT